MDDLDKTDKAGQRHKTQIRPGESLRQKNKNKDRGKDTDTDKDTEAKTSIT